MDVKTNVSHDLQSFFASNKCCYFMVSTTDHFRFQQGSVCTFDEIKKSCRNCYTTKTPLWRGGPAGPRVR